jgi:hypothetical protein
VGFAGLSIAGKRMSIGQCVTKSLESVANVHVFGEPDGCLENVIGLNPVTLSSSVKISDYDPVTFQRNKVEHQSNPLC